MENQENTLSRPLVIWREAQHPVAMLTSKNEKPTAVEGKATLNMAKHIAGIDHTMTGRMRPRAGSADPRKAPAKNEPNPYRRAITSE
jgi:hypothetical protein